MENVYLKNGECALLHNKISENEYVIERVMVYYDYEGNVDTDPCGVKEVVSEVFTKAPIEKKHEDLIKIIQKTEAKNKELADIEKQIRTAQGELRKSDQHKTDLEKQIINKSEIRNAKSITVFSDFKPYTLSEQDKKDLKISYTIYVREGEMSAWVYEIDCDGRFSGYSDSVNGKYGLIINATEDQILSIGKQIVLDKKEITEWDLPRIPEEYLTDELRIRKQELLKSRNKEAIEKVVAEIKSKNDILKELKSKK